MKEYKDVKEFSFSRNKLCLIITGFVFLIFTTPVFGVIEGITCVGNDDNIDADGLEGRMPDPCNLHAITVARNVDSNTYVQTLSNGSDEEDDGSSQESSTENTSVQ